MRAGGYQLWVCKLDATAIGALARRYYSIVEDKSSPNNGDYPAKSTEMVCVTGDYVPQELKPF